jgi:hypothetical protein
MKESLHLSLVLDVYELILKWVLNKQNRMMWNGLIWLRKGKSLRVLVNVVLKLWVSQMWKISLLF